MPARINKANQRHGALLHSAQWLLFESPRVHYYCATEPVFEQTSGRHSYFLPEGPTGCLKARRGQHFWYFFSILKITNNKIFILKRFILLTIYKLLIAAKIKSAAWVNVDEFWNVLGQRKQRGIFVATRLVFFFFMDYCLLWCKLMLSFIFSNVAETNPLQVVSKLLN